MTMTKPFKINDSIGMDYNHNLNDVFQVKKALKDLGHFKTPGYGLTAYPDMPLFDGIRSYQRTKGLAVDGVIKPNGPTAAEIGKDMAASDTRPDAQAPTPKPNDKTPDRMIHAPKQEPRTPGVFDTTGDVGWGRNNDPGDVLAARRALAWAGHLPEAKARDHKRPGNDLFRAIEAFQRQAGVKSDGWMGRGGETAKALDQAIAPKVQAYLKSVAGSGAAGGTDGKKTGDLTDSAGEPMPSRPGADPAPDQPHTDPKDQVAMAPIAAAMPYLLTGGRFLLGALAKRGAAAGTAAGAGYLAHRALEKSRKEESAPQPSQRTDIADPPPATPPLEPVEDRAPDKAVEPMEAPQSPTVPAAENPKIVNDILNGFPDGTEELEQMLILESRGDEKTQRLNNYCVDKMLEEARSRENVESVKHISGAVSGDEGELKEKLRRRKGKLRGVRADAQVEVVLKDGTKRIEDFQSIDHYADGETPDLREANAIDRIRQHKVIAKEIGDILATPKRRDLTEEEAMEICARKVEEFADKHWGPKKKKKGG